MPLVKNNRIGRNGLLLFVFPSLRKALVFDEDLFSLYVDQVNGESLLKGQTLSSCFSKNPILKDSQWEMSFLCHHSVGLMYKNFVKNGEDTNGNHKLSMS